MITCIMVPRVMRIGLRHIFEMCEAKLGIAIKYLYINDKYFIAKLASRHRYNRFLRFMDEQGIIYIIGYYTNIKQTLYKRKFDFDRLHMISPHVFYNHDDAAHSNKKVDRYTTDVKYIISD